MNPRALHIRLILWYSGLVVLVLLAFGAYTYRGMQVRLYGEMQQTLLRRVHAIGENILQHAALQKPSDIASQIEAVYSPEASNRFIRILRADHSVLYVSGMPRDKIFNPAALPVQMLNEKEIHIVELPGGARMMIAYIPVTAAGTRYFVEMGAPTEGMDLALRKLVSTLLLGLPVVVVIAAGGGYVLVRRALMPVENIRATAERITFGNLRNRLPVSRTGDALEHLSVTLNQMLERLEGAYVQASRFSADASHELRTPLSILRGELEAMVRENTLSSMLRERIGSVLEETERLSRIVESLFAISRLDAGEAKVQHVRCDLAALARNTAEQMLLLAEEKHIGVHLETPAPVQVFGDAARLKQVVVNLLDNAIKYTPNGGSIWLTVKEASHKAMMEVRDNGAGIATEALPHVFERFYRADQARSREMGGAGLGLSIVRSICQAHGGTVDIESNEGEGTTCRVELPSANGQEHIT